MKNQLKQFQIIFDIQLKTALTNNLFSHLLIVIPDSIVIDDEAHAEKRRHYSIKNDFPRTNLKERIAYI